jgi:A/G-specific adenine glycosylase
LPWRTTRDPYAILVSEIMLQQTQVPRVIRKYQEFLLAFPTFRALSRAPRSHLLKVWQGLGYNRRALNLQRCSQEVMRSGGQLPSSFKTLRNLPGIGPYTAGAVLAFAFNMAVPLIETNIRRVYLHHFFPKRTSVPDSELLPVIVRTLDRRNPRDWYSALMDYGAWLTTVVPNPNRRSKHHARQAVFAGSLRQLRGRIIRCILTTGSLTSGKLREACDSDPRTDAAVDALVREGFLVRSGRRLKCA